MVTSLLHMGIQVNSYKKAQEFFEKLDMEPIFTGTIGEFKHILNPEVDPASDPREQMGYMRIGYRQYFEMFEGIVEPPDFDPKPIYKYDDMSFVEIGLGVASLADAEARLAARGIQVKDGCIFDPDNNRYRLVELGGAVNPKHVILTLAYVAMKVNDVPAAVDFYSRIGLIATAPDAHGNVEMKCAKRGSLILVKSDKPVGKHADTALFHLAYEMDTLEDLQKSSEIWEQQGILSYRNVNKDAVLPTDAAHFDAPKGPDGSSGTRIFDPDDNYCEMIYMPEEGCRQTTFEQTHPFWD